MSRFKTAFRKFTTRAGMLGSALVLSAALVVGQAMADEEDGGAVQYVLYDDLTNSQYAEPETNSFPSEESTGGGDTGGDTGDDGHGNNGHGNNDDGVDSSNPGQGHGGPNGEVDESCDGTGDCIDDEAGGGGSSSSSSGDSSSSGNGNGNGNGNGDGNGKKK